MCAPDRLSELLSSFVYVPPHLLTLLVNDTFIVSPAVCCIKMRPDEAFREYTDRKRKRGNRKERYAMRNLSVLISPFISFCEEVELQDLDLLTEQTVGLYRRERLEACDNPVELEQEFRAVREFLEWADREDCAENLRLNPSSQEPLDGLPPEHYHISSSS